MQRQHGTSQECMGRQLLGSRLDGRNSYPSWENRKSYIGIHSLADSQHSCPLHTKHKESFAQGQNIDSQVVPKRSCPQDISAPSILYFKLHQALGCYCINL